MTEILYILGLLVLCFAYLLKVATRRIEELEQINEALIETIQSGDRHMQGHIKHIEAQLEAQKKQDETE